MLKKLEIYYNEDGEPVNIEDEKIYWDTQKNQFRHKFECCECKESLGCRCYDTLFSALTGVEDGIICEKCGINNALSELNIDDIMNRLDPVRIQKINEFVDSIITVDEINDFISETGCNKIEWGDKLEIIEYNEKDEQLKDFVIGLMTEEEKRDEFYEGCDYLAEGESCNI